MSVLLQRPRLLPASQRRRPSVPHPAECHAWTETRRSSLLLIQGLDLHLDLDLAASARSLLAPHRSTRSRETQETCRPRLCSLYGNFVHRAPLPATHAARDGPPPCPTDRPLCQQHVAPGGAARQLCRGLGASQLGHLCPRCTGASRLAHACPRTSSPPTHCLPTYNHCGGQGSNVPSPLPSWSAPRENSGRLASPALR